MNAPVIKAKNLSRHYEVGGGMFAEKQVVRALSDASFTVSRGETLAVVGESGCGKSTLARLITMIEPPTSGDLILNDQNVTPDVWRKLRSKVQMVFQDPYGSLNPRQRIGTMLEEPLKINRPEISAADRTKRAREMIEMVGLRPEHYDRYPHMFSGGQRQRIAVARALMLEPEILILDEPVSALDLSIQSQILNLLVDLQERLNLAYLFISHDLSVVKHMADKVMVMYLGRPVEIGTKDDIFNKPRHPYTKALLSATPVANPKNSKQRIKLQGELPSPLEHPPGCAFAPRCFKVEQNCRIARPGLSHDDQAVACFYPEKAPR